MCTYCVLGLLQVDPLQRLSPDEALAHDWVVQGTAFGSEKYTKEVLFPLRTKLALRKKHPSFTVGELGAESGIVDDNMNESLHYVDENGGSTHQKHEERQQADEVTDRSSIENEEFRDAAFQLF